MQTALLAPSIAIEAQSITVEPCDAQALRALLTRLESEGVSFSEHSRFLWWRRFSVTAPAEVMPTVLDLAQRLKSELWFDRMER